MTYFPLLTRYLTPPFGDDPPDGLAVYSSDIANGLPHRVDLSAELSLKLSVPSGLARQWLDVAPGTIVSSSADQMANFDPGDPGEVQGRQTPRIYVSGKGVTLGLAPLTLGRRTRFSGDDIAVEFVVLGWSISAAAVRGPTRDGSFVRMAWRVGNQAVSEFGPPPASSYVVRRIEPSQRVESELYRNEPPVYRGHLANSLARRART